MPSCPFVDEALHRRGKKAGLREWTILGFRVSAVRPSPFGCIFMGLTGDSMLPRRRFFGHLYEHAKGALALRSAV